MTKNIFYSTLRVTASVIQEIPGLRPEAIRILALRAFERMRFEPEKTTASNETMLIVNISNCVFQNAICAGLMMPARKGLIRIAPDERFTMNLKEVVV